jgi:hypothetical protein
MTIMRYFHAGNAMRVFINAMRRRRLRPEDMSDYMLRDIGLSDGCPALCEGGFAETDARSLSFARLAITPYAS